MSQWIDRRQHAGHQSTVNRARFLRRYRQEIKEKVSHALSQRGVTDLAKGEQITLPVKDLAEPQFVAGQGGRVERVLPGNDVFVSGDRMKRADANTTAQGGGEASPQGEGQDEFVFELSREEFLSLYFDDLELPDLIRKELAQIETLKTVRAGFTSSGMPTNINILRSMRQAMGRRFALLTKHQRVLRETQASLEALDPAEEHLRTPLLELLDATQKKINAVPFLDPLDLRYNHRIRRSSPTTQAVMFCLMDVSGSMDEAKKDIAKRFFMLLYLFLTKNYEKIELVFIRHHTSAKEVSEHDFFYSRETGGTVVSSALELLDHLLQTRYPANAWNSYVAQASDGDNWNADSPYCLTLLHDRIMPRVQYYAYIEIMARHHQSLWDVYQTLASHHAHFSMQSLEQVADIYPVFHDLFKRKTA